MALNYSSKHDISYANYNNKNIPWKLNTSIISQNNQITNPSLNLGTINNNLVIESSQNDILFFTSQNENKKVIVKNNMVINNLDVSNNLTTKLNDTSSITLNNKLYFSSLPVNIIGDLKVSGAITVIGSSATGLIASKSEFINVTLSGSRFTDVSIVDCNISDSSFSNVNIINSYIYNIPNGYGYDKSNNSYPNKAIFSDVSLDNLVLDSYINFDANASNSISIRSYDYDDYSKLVISKPLTVESGIRIGENISNISVFNGDISCNTLYYSQLVPDIRLNTYFDVSIGQVSVSGNNIPINTSFNIGSTNYKFNEIISTNYDGNLSGAATSANDLVKNLDMSFNNLDIYGTITLNRQNLNQFLSSDLLSINAAIIDFSNANKSVRDLSASLYSKAGFDLCLNTNFTKNRLVELSFTQLNNRIISISNIVYTKSDFDLCLNRNLIRTSDVSAIVAVVTNPGEIYPRLSYIDSSLNKITNVTLSNELVFPYAITYIDDLVEDTNLKESYSYSKTTTRYTNSTSTKYIETSTAVNNDYYDAVPQRQPNNENLTQAVMVYVNGDIALTPSRYRTWSNTSATNTLPAVYLTVKLASPRVVSYQVNTTYGSWEYHRLNAQRVRGRYLATILSSAEQTAAANAKAGYDSVYIGGRRKSSSQANITHTGGTITTSGSYTIHSFTTVGSDTFTVSADVSIDYLVVAGGGGGGVGRGGGGGAGGVKSGTITLAAGSYNITVGAGGSFAVDDYEGGDGGSSSIGSLISTTGGGGGGGWRITSGRNGGSGGGASAGATLAGGTGITGQGFAGSARLDDATGGGGGGAGAAASGKDGAIGITSTLTGTTRYYAGGGGAGAHIGYNIGIAFGGTYGVSAGTYGGGNGMSTNGSKPAYTDAVANTGGGGGGGEGYAGPSGAGGSGIVIIRYIPSIVNYANDKTSAAWEWHNGDTWSYENFGTNEPNTITQTNIVMFNTNKWDDQFGSYMFPALYMTYQLQPITSSDYKVDTRLLSWNRHNIIAQTVTNRFMATIENSTQNTWVADCISASSISDIYKNGTGVYIGAMRTSGSSASGFSASDWQWSDGAIWNNSYFYRQGEVQLYPGTTTYIYSPFIPQQPTSVSSSAPEGQQSITIDVSNTKLPSLISSVNGTITVTSSAVGALNLPASTTSNIIIGSPSSSAITSPTSTTREYTTTIATYTLTDTYAHNGTALVLSATATGGNNIDVTTNNLYRIHRFTSNGIFIPSFNGTVEVLLVGGGGGGGPSLGGGGGGGGVVYMPVVDVSAGQSYNIEVGTGGSSGTDGTASRAFTAIAAGGGSSGSYSNGIGRSGGSGGGAPANDTNGTLNQGGINSGNSLGTNNGIMYGTRGGNMTTTRSGTPTRAAGGGGAGGQGLNTDPNIRGADLNSKLTGDTGQTGAGSGGVGIINNILGTTYYWGGGGGGGAYEGQCGGYGGFGGGGGGAGNSGVGRGGINAYTNGSNGSSGNNANGGAGGANTGGGGGGGSWSSGQGGRGGDGIVIIRYLQQQPIGSFKISDNSNNRSNYIKSSASALPTSIPTNYSCIALTNDGMFVALGLASIASNVTVYMKNSSGWQTLGSPITVDFSAYTGSSVGIIPTQFTAIWRKNLQNLAINYISELSNPTLFLAFGNTRTSVQLYSYDNATWSLSNGFYSVTGGSWTLKTSYSAAALSVSTNTNFGYFVTLSHSPNVLGFTVDDKFYTYNCTNYTIRGSRQTLPNSNSTYTNIIAFKKSNDAEKIIVSNTYYVFVYKWNINITDWTLLTTINLVSTAITFTYPYTSTTPIPAGPRSLDISNISSDECVFAIGFPDVLIDTSANRKARGYVEYWKYSNPTLTRLATLVPRKRNIDSSNVDTDEYFFSGGGIKITNANTILVAPNFKFHFNNNNKNYTLDTSNVNWANHNSNARNVSGREIASIENEADNELVKITARNNAVWIGAKRTALDASSGITSAEWQWNDLSSSWNYTSFASGQPNSFSEKRIQSASGSWYDTLDSATLKAVYMTRLQYSLNTFSIFDKFYFHSSGFSSSYANTAISTTLIAKWMITDTLNRSIDFKANGSIVSNGKGIFTVSDIRLKENIVDSTPKLEDLLKVRVVNYNLKGSKDNKLIGVVAQELEQIFPTLVNNGELSMHDIYLGKTESYKSVKYSCFDVILIKAFQEHVAIINKLTSQLDEIDTKTKLLKAINKDYFILKQELDLLKSENELFKLNINEILKLI